MSEKIISFSRLLRIFKFNNQPAYIIELKENNQKTLYVSFGETIHNIRFFESYNESALKKEFKELSTHCLMSQCINARRMFENSPITHFEADCSSLVCGYGMFSSSNLCSVKSNFPLLNNGGFMFNETNLKEININFPKLKKAIYMFEMSSLEKITSQFPMLENGESMFRNTQLKDVNCQFLNLKNKEWMFENTPLELKQNCPHYFV